MSATAPAPIRGTRPDGGPPAGTAAATPTPSDPDPLGWDEPLPDDALDRTINPLSIGGLVILASNLLREADDLPRPTQVDVSETGQRIGLHFDSELASYDALWQWAGLFNTTVELSRASRKGRRLAEVTFTYYGVAVEAYAYI